MAPFFTGITRGIGGGGFGKRAGGGLLGKLNYVYSQSGATPGTFSVTSGERYVFFGVASGGNGGASGEGPSGTAGGGGGSSQINGYFWTATAPGTVTVTTAQGSNLSLILPSSSPTTIFSLNGGSASGPQYNNVGAGGTVGTFGSHAGGNGGQGGERLPNSGTGGSGGGGGGFGGSGGGGAGSFWSNYPGGVWGVQPSGGGGSPTPFSQPISGLVDPVTGSTFDIFLQDGSKGFKIESSPGGNAQSGSQVPSVTPIPVSSPPFSAPNNGASGGAGGGGGGIRFTSTSPTLGDSFGGGGGAGGSAPRVGAPGFFIAFKLVYS
jgi:hypothetical protein